MNRCVSLSHFNSSIHHPLFKVTEERKAKQMKATAPKGVLEWYTKTIKLSAIPRAIVSNLSFKSWKSELNETSQVACKQIMEQSFIKKNNFLTNLKEQVVAKFLLIGLLHHRVLVCYKPTFNDNKIMKIDYRTHKTIERKNYKA